MDCTTALPGGGDQTQTGSEQAGGLVPVGGGNPKRMGQGARYAKSMAPGQAWGGT